MLSLPTLLGLSASLLSTFVNAAAPVCTETTKTKVVVPLYQWDPDCWPELQEAAKANPTVPFIIILNPNSGPSLDANEPALRCVPVLRSVLAPGSRLIGYVRTGFGDRDMGEIQSDVAQYAKWKDITVEGGKKAKIDGIFFDETDWQESQDRLTAFSDTAKSSFNTRCAKIMFNPGTKVPNSYFSTATYVVDYEFAFEDYKFSNLPTDPKLLRKSVVMIHDFPSSSTSLSSFLKPLIDAKVGGVYVTDLKIAETDVYASFGPNWKDFVAEVGKLSSA